MGLKRRGKKIPPQPFSMGRQPGESADDRCITKGVPCAHLAKVNDGDALVIVPSPANAERSGNWRGLGFWVMD